MEKYYEKTNWENLPSENTSINADRLNNIEDGIDTIDNRVCELDAEKSNVKWNQLQQTGKKIAEIEIDDIKQIVYAPISEGGGGTGSNVQWNQIKTSGEKIAEITIDGATTNVYASQGGGTGGSSVEWQQLETEGKHIANITIDGETTEVFASEGGGVDVVELTKAEYDALPDSKLTDNIPRYIKDYSEGSSMNAYELEEKEIGTCLGKTLYRQGYQCDISLSSSTSTLAIKKSDWNIEQVLNAIWIRVSTSRGGCARPQVWCDGDSLKIDNASSYGLSSGEHSYLWLEYTKVGG